jgi:superfamily II DNA or RNA helicase
MQELRPYQLDAVSRLREGIRAGRRKQVLQVATGGGKTAIAAHMTRSAIEKGSRVFFLADRIELIDQASARFDAEGISHGIMQGNHWRHRPWSQVQIATIQTLVNRQYEQPDMIVVDECHAGGKRLNDFVSAFPGIVIGLSATPWAKGMGKVYDDLVVGATTSQLIELGYLVDVEAWAPSEPDLTGVKVVAGEWEDKALAQRCDTPRLVGDIVEHWMTRARGRQTIAFAVDVAHSKHIVEQFQAAGVRAAHVDGYDQTFERRKTIEAFRRGELELICNVGILDKGFDVPEASCLVMARPIRSSLMLHIQQIGRVLRASPGKTNALILDHAGNMVRHGFPTEQLPEKLDDGKKKPKAERMPKEREPKPCPKCKYLKRPGQWECPNCGFKPERKSAIEGEAGELVKIEKTQDKRRIYAELRSIQIQRGRKDGWLAHTFRKLTGVWPNHYHGTPPATPTEWTINRVRHLDIAYAKSREVRA